MQQRSWRCECVSLTPTQQSILFPIGFFLLKPSSSSCCLENKLSSNLQTCNLIVRLRSKAQVKAGMQSIISGKDWTYWQIVFKNTITTAQCILHTMNENCIICTMQYTHVFYRLLTRPFPPIYSLEMYGTFCPK